MFEFTRSAVGSLAWALRKTASTVAATAVHLVRRNPETAAKLVAQRTAAKAAWKMTGAHLLVAGSMTRDRIISEAARLRGIRPEVAQARSATRAAVVASTIRNSFRKGRDRLMGAANRTASRTAAVAANTGRRWTMRVNPVTVFVSALALSAAHVWHKSQQVVEGQWNWARQLRDTFQLYAPPVGLMLFFMALGTSGAWVAVGAVLAVSGIVSASLDENFFPRVVAEQPEMARTA